MCSQQDASSLSLPDDVASCHELIQSLSRTLADRESHVQKLEAVIDQLIRERFGPKRERYVDPDQLQLFEEASDGGDASAEQTEPSEEGERPKKPRGGTGNETVVVADKPPEMIEKGAADASLLAHLTTSKQGDHLPLYRYEEISLRSGWWIPRSTQVGWLYQTSLTAVLLYAWMASRILKGRLVSTDATGAPVLEPRGRSSPEGNGLGLLWAAGGLPVHDL
jgi:hypothetical protein